MAKLWALLENIIHFFLYKVFRLKLSEENYKKFLQFVQFLLVGFSNAVIYYGLYLLMIQTSMHYEVAHFLSFSISILNSYFWNKTVVFKEESEEKQVWWKVLIKTYLAYVSTGLLLGSALLYVWVDVLALPDFVGPIINILITTPLNFVINKFWAYRGRKKKNESEKTDV